MPSATVVMSSLISGGALLWALERTSVTCARSSLSLLGSEPRLAARSLLAICLTKLQKSLLASPLNDGVVVLASSLLSVGDAVVALLLRAVVALLARAVVALPPEVVALLTDAELSPPQPARSRATRAPPAIRPEAFMTIS